MVVTYYIKLFRTGADRHNGILKSLLLLVAETKKRASREVLSFKNFIYEEKCGTLKQKPKEFQKHFQKYNLLSKFKK